MKKGGLDILYLSILRDHCICALYIEATDLDYVHIENLDYVLGDLDYVIGDLDYVIGDLDYVIGLLGLWYRRIGLWYRLLGLCYRRPGLCYRRLGLWYRPHKSPTTSHSSLGMGFVPCMTHTLDTLCQDKWCYHIH